MSDHATLSPSSASRWMACPGSVPLIATLPVGDRTSDAAEEGTHAHAALEHCLKEATHPNEFIDSWFHDRDLTAETAAAIAVAYDYVMQYAEKGAEFVAERKVRTGETLGRDDIYGTADITITHPGGVPEIVDYKHGRGVLVEVEDNRQLQIYLLGVMEADGIPRDTGGFTTIIQPRCKHPSGEVIRSTGYAPEQLTQIVDEIKTAAAATEAPQPEFNPGESQCRWCDAKGVCPALANKSLNAAAAVFGYQSDTPTAADVRTILSAEHADCEVLTPEQVAEIVSIEPMISGWLKAVREHAVDEINAGGKIPGYKMVAGRKTRSWDESDEEIMLKWLAGRGKTDKKKIALDGASVRKILSPAQAEKRIKPLVSVATWANISARIMSSTGSPVLAPETDARQDINTTAADVLGVPSLF
jgi:RecB family exonuclease